jgi:hypothetical protein
MEEEIGLGSLQEDFDNELNHYLETVTRMRKAKEDILKDMGLNWKSLQELESRVIDAIPSEGLEKNGYKVLVKEKNIVAGRSAEVKVLGTKKHTSIHKL